MDSLPEHLVPNADNPVDGAFEFVSGKFARLDTPVNLNPGDERSPLLVAGLAVDLLNFNISPT